MSRFVGAKGTLYAEWCIFKGQKSDHAEVVVGDGLNGCSSDVTIAVSYCPNIGSVFLQWRRG